MNRVIFMAGYLDGDDQLTEMKGHRSDVLFEDDNGIHFQLNFIDMDRLKLEFDSNFEKGINYFTDVGLIVLDKVTRNEIIYAVQNLKEKRYFLSQKPVILEPEDQWFYIDLI